jgi:hypothetical protein
MSQSRQLAAIMFTDIVGYTALMFYQKGGDLYPGFPVQHDNWNIIIDQAWIEERIESPFKGIN